MSIILSEKCFRGPTLAQKIDGLLACEPLWNYIRFNVLIQTRISNIDSVQHINPEELT